MPKEKPELFLPTEKKFIFKTDTVKELIIDVSTEIYNIMPSEFNQNFQQTIEMTNISQEETPIIYAHFYMVELLNYFNMKWMLGTDVF